MGPLMNYHPLDDARGLLFSSWLEVGLQAFNNLLPRRRYTSFSIGVLSGVIVLDASLAFKWSGVFGWLRRTFVHCAPRSQE